MAKSVRPRPAGSERAQQAAEAGAEQHSERPAEGTDRFRESRAESRSDAAEEIGSAAHPAENAGAGGVGRRRGLRAAEVAADQLRVLRELVGRHLLREVPARDLIVDQ